jgi:outer membrane protein
VKWPAASICIAILGGGLCFAQTTPSTDAKAATPDTAPPTAGASRSLLLPLTGTPLSLDDAEAIAIRNQPLLLAAQQRARAVSERIREQRSAELPTVNFNTTGALVADPGTATAAGALTTSSVSDRLAYGGTLVQLVTDFGRSSALIESARAAAEAQRDLATLTRAQIRLNVYQAFYQVMGAEAVLRAAQQAEANRHLISSQVTALSQSQLRSTLDVNFAHVLESQADLAVVRAESAVAQKRIELATAMGEFQPVTRPLAQQGSPPPLADDPDAFVTGALRDRADLNAARASQQAADRFATAEKRLSLPSLNLLGAAGQIPYHDHTLQGDYAAAGFNLNIPVFNGGLFAARRREAAFDATARRHDVEQQTLVVNQQVRNDWYLAAESYRSIAVTERLVAEARQALTLAQARYGAGLGSIVELNEAQLNETSAEITAADATYTYLSRRAALEYAAGLLN